MVDSRNAIIPWSGLLQNSMPMNRSALFGARDLVTYIHGDGITPVSFDGWTGKLPVNKDRASVYSIGGDVATSDVEVVRRALAACSDN